MRFAVEQQIDERWYSREERIEARSAGQAVAMTARSDGVFRVREAGSPDSTYEVYQVPSWGPPVALDGS